MQRLGNLEYGNSTCNQITYRPVGRPGDLVETVSPNTARERRPVQYSLGGEKRRKEEKKVSA